jgi:DNA modification methylase
VILRGNALTIPLADDTVDLVVTSPPYFGLRSYQDGGEHYAGQIGDEATPAEFVDALVAATAELVRVVKPSGSIFVNLGDKYNAYNGGRGPGTIQTNDIRQAAPRGNGLDVKGVKPKSLMLIPQRYAIRCVDELGLILRAEIIWSKPNGLPESVTDRVRRSHEFWFHFTLSPRYYSAVDEIREPQATLAHKLRYGGTGYVDPSANGAAMPGTRGGWENLGAPNPLGKLPGSVWTIPTEPLQVPDHLGVDHFAAYPTEWPRRIIQGWSPSGICTACGEGRRPVVDKGITDFAGYRATNGHRQDGKAVTPAAAGMDRAGAPVFSTLATITGEVCACPDPSAPTRPATVLDPFGGTGTTALVATALGRRAVHVDMSADYCRLATWRTTDPKQRAKAARREYTPPPEQTTGQLDLLEGLGA